MNCIIVDDDETSRIVLSNLANKIGSINLITTCSSSAEARELMKSIRVDLLLLDIEMPEETGVAFFESITSNTDVIFITSQTKHAVRAFENDAIDYIIKPVNLDRLRKAIKKAERRRNKVEEEISSENFIFINQKGVLTKIIYHNILYIEASKGYVKYHLKDKTILSNGTLKKVEEKLNPLVFIRVHRSFIANINMITKYHTDSITVENTSIPLSRLYRKEVSSKLNSLII
jgi:DNA-binding LytR/AlgR family response regulator